ncbi:hypothetical protein CHISP_1720 [Chitinispirillum alkaliphilum]|nr:hypothetical protein CHISP_1720 [Chitinispirillum alkaliphilum]
MNSLTIGFTLILGVVIIFVSAKVAALPLLLAASIIPGSAVLEIGSFSFNVVRILLLFYTIRIITKHEATGFRFNMVDKAVFLYAAVVFIMGFVPREDLTLIYRLGQIYDLAGFYFVFRILVRSKEILLTTMSGLAVFMIILALFMMYEHRHTHNLLGYFGGPLYPQIREGKVRAQGAFAHAILAGTIGATTSGIFIGAWFERSGRRWLYFLGILASLTIVWASASSGPFMSAVFLLIGIVTWYARNKMSIVRWGIVFSLILLDVFMKAPIWYLIGRIDITGSSTGFHRSELITSAIKYFDEWWLVGTDYTRHWMATGVSWSPRHSDITNNYIRQAVQGGLLQLTAFLVIIIRAFRYVGYIIKSLCTENKSEKFSMWCLGAVLFSHIVTFFSVGYFDQSNLFFILNVALIASGDILISYNKEHPTST